MLAPWTRVAELRALIEELAAVDWRDPAWWGLLAVTALGETLADLGGAQPARDLIHGGGPDDDTFMGWPAPPSRGLAEAIADAVLGAAAAVTAIAEVGPMLDDQPLDVEVVGSGGRLSPVDPTRVRFAIGERCVTARIGRDRAGRAALAAALGRLALAGEGAGDGAPAAVVAVIGDHDPSVARHLHRWGWRRGAGPWLGVGRAGQLAVASTCHRVIDGYGHALIADRLAAADATDRDALIAAAAAVVGSAPVPPAPVPPQSRPLGVAWRRLAGWSPRLTELAHPLGVLLRVDSGDPTAAMSPVIQVPLARGPRDDASRWRRRVTYTLLSVRFEGDDPEPLERFRVRAGAAFARELAGRGLVSRLIGGATALPLPAIAVRRVVAAGHRGWRSGPAVVLGGAGSLSRLAATREGPLVAVSGPSRLSGPEAPVTASVTVVVDPGGSTITVAGSGRAGDRAGAAALLDALVERARAPAGGLRPGPPA